MSLRTFSVLVAMALAACTDVPIADGLGESRARAVVLALDRAGIAATSTATESSAGVTMRIGVVRDDVPRAVSVLREVSAAESPRGDPLPREAPSTWIPALAEQRARVASDRAADIAETLGSIPGVRDARVHLALPDPETIPLDQTAPPRASASVLVRYRDPAAPRDIAAIQRVVAGAVQGMRADDVTVLAVDDRDPSPGPLQLARIGPFTVSQRSEATLRWTLIGSLFVHCLLAAAVIWLTLRGRADRLTN